MVRRRRLGGRWGRGSFVFLVAWLVLALPAGAASDIDLRRVREQAERQAVVTALARASGNILRASEMLGVSRPTLYDLMHRLAIK